MGSHKESAKTLDIYLANTIGNLDADTNDSEPCVRYDNALIIENGVMRMDAVTIRQGVLPTAAGMFGPPAPRSGRYTATLNENGVVTSVTPNIENRKAVSVNVADGELLLGMFDNVSRYDFAPDAKVYVYHTTGGGMIGVPPSITSVLESGITVGQYIARVQSFPDSFNPNAEIAIYLDLQGKVTELLVAETSAPIFGSGAASVNRLFDLLVVKPLTDEQLIAAGIPAEYKGMDTVRSVGAGVYDPIKYGADAGKKYPLMVFLHGMGGGGTESGPLSSPAAFVKPAFQADFPDGAAYVVAPRANEHLPGGPTWLEGPGGFLYADIGMSEMDIMGGPDGPDGQGGPTRPGVRMVGFGGIAVYAPVLVQLIKDVLKAYPNADPDRIYVLGFSAGGSMTQRLVYYTETGDRGVKIAAAAPAASPFNLTDEQFPAVRDVPMWMMVGLYDSVAYSDATPDACNAVNGFAIEGRDNARVTVFETMITPQGVTVHQHMVPTAVENNMIFGGNVPTNWSVFKGGEDGGMEGVMMVNGRPGHVTVGIPAVLDGPYMQWYGTIFDKDDPRYKFGANPASNYSNHHTFVSWISKWSLNNRP
jgi:predicted esterase